VVLCGFVAQDSVVFPESSGFVHHWWHPLNIHSPQLGKAGKYKRGKLGIICLFVCLMVFSANFNNISAISLGVRND
jgi:hypothetical protein